MDTLAGNKWFSKLDVNADYWQIKIKSEDREKLPLLQNMVFLNSQELGLVYEMLQPHLPEQFIWFYIGFTGI